MSLSDPDYSDLIETRHATEDAQELHQAEQNGDLLSCEISVKNKYLALSTQQPKSCFHAPIYH